MSKTCNTCNNYERDTGECIGEPSNFILGDGTSCFRPPDDFTCKFWTPRPCLKEYGKCDCEKCLAKMDALRDEDEDSRRCGFDDMDLILDRMEARND